MAELGTFVVRQGHPLDLGRVGIGATGDSLTGSSISLRIGRPGEPALLAAESGTVTDGVTLDWAPDGESGICSVSVDADVINALRPTRRVDGHADSLTVQLSLRAADGRLHPETADGLILFEGAVL